MVCGRHESRNANCSLRNSPEITTSLDLYCLTHCKFQVLDGEHCDQWTIENDWNYYWDNLPMTGASWDWHRYHHSILVSCVPKWWAKAHVATTEKQGIHRKAHGAVVPEPGNQLSLISRQRNYCTATRTSLTKNKHIRTMKKYSIELTTSCLHQFVSVATSDLASAPRCDLNFCPFCMEASTNLSSIFDWWQKLLQLRLITDHQINTLFTPGS